MKKVDLTKFTADLTSLELSLSEQQLQQFIRYYELLVEWNSFMNLTGITEWEEVCKKHFVDSLSMVKLSADKSLNDDINDSTSLENPLRMDKVESLIDIGTGAGFPGIPLKIAFPHLRVTLLDSLNKRIDFLNCVIQELQLEKINTVHGRAEDYVKTEGVRESYDLCVSRAVSSLPVLSEYCVPYVKKDGFFIPYKSEKSNEEIEKSKNAFAILGCELQDIVEYTLPDSDIFRTLLVIKKVNSTPTKYPRKAGIPLKKPL